MTSKSFPIDVMNLATGAIYTYQGITPKEALVCAVEQQERHNFKTYDYDFDKYEIQEGKLTIGIGDYATFKDGRRL